jgi:hypothetical protein
MVSPFETVILRLRDLGVFQFLLPFILTAAIFYGLLRKSQLFGKPEENVAVNAVVALTAAFMVWAYPILAGVNIEQQLSIFFFNGTVAMLVIIVSLLIASMFGKPDLTAYLSEKLGNKWFAVVIIAGVLIGFAILISSGLVNIFIPTGIFTGISSDILLTVVVLLLLVGAIFAVVLPGGK